MTISLQQSKEGSSLPWNSKENTSTCIFETTGILTDESSCQGGQGYFWIK